MTLFTGGSREGVAGSRDGAVVRAFASHQCVPGSISGPGVIWIVICGLSLLLVLFLAPRGFSPGTPVFPISSKINISKFKFDLDYCQAHYYKPLARVIVQALPVFDIKFTFTFYIFLPWLETRFDCLDSLNYKEFQEFNTSFVTGYIHWLHSS